jgi:hypothetical protein
MQVRVTTPCPILFTHFVKWVGAHHIENKFLFAHQVKWVGAYHIQSNFRAPSFSRTM